MPIAVNVKINLVDLTFKNFVNYMKVEKHIQKEQNLAIELYRLINKTLCKRKS